MKKGKFIVLDGTDGSGKSTQLKLLNGRIRKIGLKTKYIHIPQHGTRSAAMVDDYLNGKYGKVDAYTASLFYAIDRFDAAVTIRKWLSQGYVVLCDRWVTANAGHQGGKIKSSRERLKLFKWLQEIEYGVCNLPRPDITVILDMPAKIARQLIEKKDARGSDRTYIKGKKDLHEKDFQHLADAERAFVQIPKVFKKTHIIVCAERGRPFSREAINEKLWNIVTKA